MNHFLKLLKNANISGESLGEAMGISARNLSRQFTTGRIPYATIYKMATVTGIPIEKIVPKFLADEWCFLIEEQEKNYKKRGRTASKWSKNLELTEPQANQDPDEEIEDEEEFIPAPPPPVVKKKAPRETSKKPETAPKTQKAADIPKGVTKPSPQIGNTKRGSIADIMSAAPPVPDVEEPDFSHVPDDVFSTSMAPENNPVRRKR